MQCLGKCFFFLSHYFQKEIFTWEIFCDHIGLTYFFFPDNNCDVNYEGVLPLQPNIFSHVHLMVYFSLIYCCSICGSTLPIIGSWTEHWVFRKSNVQFAKVVKQNIFCSWSHNKTWTAVWVCLCLCTYTCLCACVRVCAPCIPPF